MEWIKGKPPALEGYGIWVVIELPSWFSPDVVTYKTAVWWGEKWSTKEVERATRWAILPLPEKEEQE